MNQVTTYPPPPPSTTSTPPPTPPPLANTGGDFPVGAMSVVLVLCVLATLFGRRRAFERS